MFLRNLALTRLRVKCNGAPKCKVVRDHRGRFSTDKPAIREKKDNARRKRVQQNIILEHNYPIGHIHDDVCNLNGCEDCCPGFSRLLDSRKIETEEWKEGCLIDSLSHCKCVGWDHYNVHMETLKVK